MLKINDFIFIGIALIIIYMSYKYLANIITIVIIIILVGILVNRFMNKLFKETDQDQSKE